MVFTKIFRMSTYWSWRDGSVVRDLAALPEDPRPSPVGSSPTAAYMGPSHKHPYTHDKVIPKNCWHLARLWERKHE